jgi:hypothetical protein
MPRNDHREAGGQAPADGILRPGAGTSAQVYAGSSVPASRSGIDVRQGRRFGTSGVRSPRSLFAEDRDARTGWFGAY